jgi:hypothetical protein
MKMSRNISFRESVFL